MAGRRGYGWLAAVAGVTAAGAAIRFATLSVQSFWLDEAVTHRLVTSSLGAMLRAIPHSESTPPLYYVLAWAWSRVFGAGEAGLRSLSALFGTATIVLVALIARRLAGDRAAVAAAALAAANPLLIWYSQEARAYALLVALCAVTVWCLLRRDWIGWAIAAALALATHYFAVFIVVPELAWALSQRELRPKAARAALVPAAAAVALLPLAITQASGSRAAFIHSTSLASRVAAVPKQLLIGYATPGVAALTAVAAVLAVALAAGLRRKDAELAGLALAAVGVPVVLAVLGADYLITRNVIAAMVPLVVLGAVASTRLRLGPLLVAGICAAGAAAFVGVELTPSDQRDDWRAVAAQVGSLAVPRAVVLEPASGAPAFEIYVPMVPLPGIAARTVSEIDVVELGSAAPRVVTPVAFAGFAVSWVRMDGFVFIRYQAPAPVVVNFGQLVTLAPAQHPAVFVNQ